MAAKGPAAPRFFRSAAEFRAWLEKSHATSRETWVGFYNQRSGKKGISYKEAVDVALCLGWIDGVRKSLDAGRYKVRFTPRRPRSVWSLVNLERARALRKLGRMAAAGLEAFATRDAKRSGVHSVERARASLGPALELTFRANAAAWAFFQSQPPGYRRTITWWVVSAKTDQTRQRRLEVLIDLSARRLRHPALDRRAGAPAD